MTDSRFADVLNSGNFYCLMGAPLDTGNLGVSALGLSVIESIAQREPDWTPVLLDYSRGVSTSNIKLSDGRTISAWHVGTSPSRRFWRKDTLNCMQLCQMLGLPHLAVTALKNSRAVLDISGGDSFTDLYGSRRFTDVTLRKQIAIQAGARLILLPQTYGPYQAAESKRIAQRLVSNSRAAWARDPRSFETLKTLCNGSATHDNLHQGVDVAFGLPVLEPADALSDLVQSWTEDSEITVGINISGLIYNGGDDARKQYGLKGNYRDLIEQFMLRFLNEEGIRVVLVPHVIPHSNSLESDTIACQSVRSSLPDNLQSRVHVLPEIPDPRIAKWVISHFDWFCGTRMHATIASLSTGVPTGALAYSLKTKGVFETCECGDCVVELRDEEVPQALVKIWDCFERRATVKETLSRSIPLMIQSVNAQSDAIVALMRASASAGVSSS